MPAIELDPAQRKARRSEAHHLHPVVAIGADGLTEAVLRECDAALAAHALIKVRVFSDDRAGREALLATLAERLEAAPVQHIGKLLVLWRPIPEKPQEPDGARPARRGPKLVQVLKFSRSGNHRPQVKKLKVLGNQRLTPGGTVKRAKKRRASIKKSAAD